MTPRDQCIATALLLTATAVLLPHRALAQEPTTRPSAPPPQMEDMMAKWAEMNALGPEHHKFKEMVGTWSVETKMWMFPNTPPMIAQGTAEFRLIFGGRFIEQRFKCPMMGMPFEGVSIEGYDRIKKKYVSIWFDNTSNSIQMSMGTPDASGNSMTYYGTGDDPLTGEQDQMMRYKIEELDKHRVRFEMFEKRSGMDEFKSMEITYTRAP